MRSRRRACASSSHAAFQEEQYGRATCHDTAVAARDRRAGARRAAVPGARHDPAAGDAALIEEWFARGDAGLRSFAPDVEPVIWPEHFDLAITLDEVNHGISPGDAVHPLPYAHVGPWTPREGAFWNVPFCALQPAGDLPDAHAVAAFFAKGRPHCELWGREGEGVGTRRRHATALRPPPWRGAGSDRPREGDLTQGAVDRRDDRLEAGVDDRAVHTHAPEDLALHRALDVGRRTGVVTR